MMTVLATTLANIITGIAVDLVKDYLNREEIRRGERYKMLAIRLGVDADALAFMAEAAGRPDVADAARLRVRSGGGVVRLGSAASGPDQSPGAGR